MQDWSLDVVAAPEYHLQFNSVSIMPSHLFGFIVINGLLLVIGFYSPLHNARIPPHSRKQCQQLSQKQSLFSCRMADNSEIETGDQNPEAEAVGEADATAYLGPTADFDDMEAGCSIGDLGTY